MNTRERAEKIKNRIAQIKGYPSWAEMENWIIDHNEVQDAVLVMMSAMGEVLEEFSSLPVVTDEEIKARALKEAEIYEKMIPHGAKLNIAFEDMAVWMRDRLQPSGKTEQLKSVEEEKTKGE